MKFFAILAALVCGFTIHVFADGTKTGKPKKIPASEADNHYLETITVTGKVVQVTLREKLVYLNLD